MVVDRSFCSELFADMSFTLHWPVIYLYMDDMEPWEVGELIDDVYPILYEVIPDIKLEVDGYRTYEEEYGGFLAHGILKIDMQELSKDDLIFVKKVIFENMY